MATTARDEDAAGSDEFVDGSIFRVKLHNFLTYTDAEFYPGPRLNLILGPNGTGKSSIVCALCVGLAGSTRIELFFERGNKVIRRNIFRDNKSTWMVDGRDSTLKNVVGIMEAAKIQIDNLCQFLPQDKVGEFSRMNPVQLLKATENAITDGDLASHHEHIIELQNSMSDKGRELEHARSSLELKKSENSEREKEVERIEDYEARIEEVMLCFTEVMERKCLWLEFEEVKREVEALKEEKKRCRDEMENAREEKIAPLEELLEKESIKLEDIDAMESAQSQTVSELKQLRNQHQHSRKRLERWEHDLVEVGDLYTLLRKERAEMPDDAELKREKAHLETEQRAKGMEVRGYPRGQLYESLARELTYVDDEQRKVTAKLAQLENEDVQRRLALQRGDADSIRAAEWVKNNQHLLKRKVWGPVVLEVCAMTVNETLHAKYVEDTLPKWLMGALITECYADYNTILKELGNDSSGRRIKVSVLNVENGRCHAVTRPYSGDLIASLHDKYGIDGFLDEVRRDVSGKEEAMTRKLKGQAAKQGRQIKLCLKLSKELLMASARDTSLSLQLGTQQIRVDYTQKHLKQTENMLRYQAKDNLMDTAKKAMKLKRRAEQEAPWEEHEERFAKLSDDLDELRGKIENNKAALDCFRGDRSIRELYERVCAEIKEDEARLADLENYVTNGEDEINGVKGSWHASLKEVVRQIDASFKEFFMDIGCVGEIVLDDEDPDVSKWGIQRRAQFRKNTKLSTMTAEEQSGGEKSVGTIMYLMALQSLTKCPFRVVDEINQGMDVYNERKVFQRITKSSCGSKMPQYFLITPKLITGLTYHPDTKVMVILNGPWNKIRQELWDPDRFIACGQQVKRKLGSALSGGAAGKKRARA
ncbi:hypothetical protein BBJ28_00013452 [Nothophytophthora sp. Chile5]|nr:hypothetical protein BBJ28_00013452 [Nothophytophthora sp. Chile5]